jgi:hypothetical protein
VVLTPRGSNDDIRAAGASLDLRHVLVRVSSPYIPSLCSMSPTQPIGRFKHRFFSRLGHTDEQWTRFETDLRELAGTEEATPGERSEYVRKSEVGGMLKGP